MSRLRVRPAAQALAGSVSLPSDKSISHRALIFAALASGTSTLRGFTYGEDNLSTLRIFEALGVRVEDSGGSLAVHGVGLGGLKEARGDLDCGNSGTTMRLMSGVLAAQSFRSRLVGDASLSRRPMMRIARPLRARGAVVDGSPHPGRDDITPPLTVGPLPQGRKLSALEYELPVPSAQVKSCVLLSGLFAEGPTVVIEQVQSRDHTERMLRACGLTVETEGNRVSLDPPRDTSAIAPFDVDLPGDLSAAAFLLVAGQIVPRSTVRTHRTGLNPTRAGILDIIRQFGGNVVIEPSGESLGEPVGTVSTSAGSLYAGRVEGELAVRAIDEIPIAAVLAARSYGATEFSDVAELRVKESDRITLITETLKRFGVPVDERPDGFTVLGRPDGRLKAARVQSGGDHRIAMSAAVLGLVADGETIVEDVDCVATSYPGFAAALASLGADVTVES